VASFSYFERTFTIRVGMQHNDGLGSTRVREVLGTVDYQYDEERWLWEERERERHRKPIN
jgi:hypothetical protein